MKTLIAAGTPDEPSYMPEPRIMVIGGTPERRKTWREACRRTGYTPHFVGAFAAAHRLEVSQMTGFRHSTVLPGWQNLRLEERLRIAAVVLDDMKDERPDHVDKLLAALCSKYVGVLMVMDDTRGLADFKQAWNDLYQCNSERPHSQRFETWWEHKLSFVTGALEELRQRHDQ